MKINIKFNDKKASEDLSKILNPKLTKLQLIKIEQEKFLKDLNERGGF